MKRCKTCGEEKPKTEFYKGSNGQGLRTSCKPCHNEITSKYMRQPEVLARLRARHAAFTPEEKTAHKERVRTYHRRSKYGLSALDWTRMQEMQDGVCAICGDREATHVDHCHDSGANRMILCNQCNQLLGFGRDDPHTLRAAADYLESYK